MLNKSLSLNDRITFGAVKFTPNISEWNPRILEAVLDSTAVKKAVFENESTGYDTLIFHSKRPKERSFYKIDEFVVSKLGTNFNNIKYNVETYVEEKAIEAVINFIKLKDAELNISAKLEKFNEFVKSINKK